MPLLPSVYDDVARDLERETGITRAQFWWSVTHSHAAPEVGPPGVYKSLLGRSDHEYDRDYAALVKDSLIRAVKEARAKLEPARIAFGQGVSMANINRRAKDVDGQVSLGLNPDGPADRQIGLIRLDRPDGTPIATIANYAIHGTVMSGQNLLISGDAPGTVSRTSSRRPARPCCSSTAPRAISRRFTASIPTRSPATCRSSTSCLAIAFWQPRAPWVRRPPT